MDKIAVLIPCFNEEKTIAKVIRDWKAELPEAVIYVYDNNSTDDTYRIAAAEGIVVKREPCQGKGNVVRRMFREIDAECYILVDGDDTYPADNGREMVDEVLKNKADMVVGDRLSSTYAKENKRPLHNSGNNFVRFLVNRLFGADVKDIMTGLRAFSFLFVKTFPVTSKGFEIETEMTIHAIEKNLNIKNVVIKYRDRPEGSTSKLDTYSDGMKVLRTISKLYRDYKPFHFYGVRALLLILVAVGFFIPVFCDYLRTGLVQRFPTLIVCCFCAVAAMVAFFAGLILQTIVNSNRQSFEFNLQEAERWKKDSMK